MDGFDAGAVLKCVFFNIGDTFGNVKFGNLFTISKGTLTDSRDSIILNYTARSWWVARQHLSAVAVIFDILFVIHLEGVL